VTDTDYDVPYPYYETLKQLTPDGRTLFDELYYGLVDIRTTEYRDLIFRPRKNNKLPTDQAFHKALAAVRKLGLVKPPEPKKEKTTK
jgi:hypothetical protein